MNKNVAKIRNLVRSDHRLTIWEMADELNINISKRTLISIVPTTA